jgi:putative transposase
MICAPSWYSTHSAWPSPSATPPQGLWHIRTTVLEYASLLYGTYAKGSGIDLSMGSIGDPWDNAVAETFFASLEKELLRRERFATREAARMRIFWYIECFYNTRRRHSGLGYLSPADYETHHQQEAIAA